MFLAVELDGAKSYVVLGVGVHGGRCRERLVEQLADQGYAATATDQHDRTELVRRQAGGVDRSVERGDAVGQGRSDQALELAPGEPQRRVQSGERDRQHGVHIGGQRFLRVDAVSTQPG